LSSNEQRLRLAHSIAQRESSEIGALLSDSTLRLPSSVELGWKDFAVERRTILPGERPELTLQHHFLVLWDEHVAEGEMAYRGGRFSPYKKHPNTITTCLPGIRPAARNRSRHEVIVGALSADFIRGIEAELDRRPGETSHGLHGADDPDLRNLLLLLFKESNTGGRCGTLYAESLIAALATRLLYAARFEKLPANDTAGPLPPRLLRRVVDLMQADLSRNLGNNILD
jgi:AraC family transcriptional regulator